MPNCEQTNTASSCDSAMFFGVSGSIAGGTMLTPPLRPAGTYVVHVEQRRLVGQQVRQQLPHRRRVGRRDVDVAAPDPVRRLLRHQRADRRRLRVVDDAVVPPARELARVHLVVLAPGRPLLLGQILRMALERVVHQLRGVEELLAAVDHVPLGVQARRRASAGSACRGSRRRRRRTPSPTGAGRACPRAARRDGGPPRPGRGRRCACSPRGSCGRRRRAGARAGGYLPSRSASWSGRSPSRTSIVRLASPR